MAGPGIRYHYMAEQLSTQFDVTVGFFDPSYVPEAGFKRSYDVASIDARLFETSFKDFGVVIAHWLSEPMISYCNQHQIFIVFDLYVVGPVENLVSSLFNDPESWSQNDEQFDQSLAMYRHFFANGDLFLFSNRRQLDYWTGYVFGADQVHLANYSSRPIYDRFISAPMGIDTGVSIKSTRPVIKGVMNGISKTDKVLLWTGGIWGHFDAQVLIRAMKSLENKRPDIKLVFFGIKHPNPSVKETKESLETQRLATELGLVGKNVFFNKGWVKYGERIDYLLEADVAVNTHRASIETEFSHRTRVLDHLLADLPTISTEGDYLSDEIIAPKKLGFVVPPNDEAALEKAILDILEPKILKEVKASIKTERRNLDWSVTLAGLSNLLVNRPGKLDRLQMAPKLKKSNKATQVAKKVLPLSVKKALIKTRNHLK